MSFLSNECAAPHNIILNNNKKLKYPQYVTAPMSDRHTQDMVGRLGHTLVVDFVPMMY